MSRYIGKEMSRVDGVAKVTGKAKYAAEFNVPGLTYGVVVSSTIARGHIRKLDTQEALAVPGVLHVFTHENRPKLPWFDRSYREALDAAAQTLRLDELEKFLVHWRRIAWSATARDHDRWRAVLARAEHTLRTGEPPPGTVSEEEIEELIRARLGR